MKICSVSDVHASDRLSWFQEKTPDADVLTVSGDLTRTGTIEELKLFRKWLVEQPQKNKVVIAGNHDFCLEDPRKRLEAENILGGNGIIYLRDEVTVIDGVKFYGSPWQPWFHDWAFNLKRGPEIRAKWDLIPHNTDVLVVHGPPFMFGDTTVRGDSVGCVDLLDAIKQVKPQLVCYGHIHEDAGERSYIFEDGRKTMLVNCSVGYNVGPLDKAQRIPRLTTVKSTLKAS